MLLAYNTPTGWRCCLCKQDYEIKKGDKKAAEFLQMIEKELYHHLDRIHYRAMIHYVEDGYLPKTGDPEDRIPRRRYEGPSVRNELR